MLSRNLFTSGGDNLGTVCVPNRNRIHGAGLACAQQLFSGSGLENQERRYARVIEYEGRGSFRNAVAKADAERAVDAHSQLADVAFFEVPPAHIPSRPSSARAVSMMAGVISVMPRSFAYSA